MTNKNCSFGTVEGFGSIFTNGAPARRDGHANGGDHAQGLGFGHGAQPFALPGAAARDRAPKPARTTRWVYVTGLADGREVFVGRTGDDLATSSRITVEGKAIAWGPERALLAQPFATSRTFSTTDGAHAVHVVTDDDAVRELDGICRTPTHVLGRTTHPRTWRWIESATGNAGGAHAESSLTHGIWNGFTATAARFRAALFASPGITTTRELDSLTEIEGQAAIELGRAANHAAVRFQALTARFGDLTAFLDAVHGGRASGGAPGGWSDLFARADAAKAWARRNGSTSLVRDLNRWIRDGIDAWNGIVLDACAELDTLITETFNQHGITSELYGDLSPFTGWTGASPSPHTRNANPGFAGTGACAGSAA